MRLRRLPVFPFLIIAGLIMFVGANLAHNKVVFSIGLATAILSLLIIQVLPSFSRKDDWTEVYFSKRRITSGLESGGGPRRSFIGGMNWGGFINYWNITTPFARLEIFSNGIRVGPSFRMFRPMLPLWEARFDELQSVVLLQAIFGQGVRFRTNDDDKWIIFWYQSPQTILEVLRELGVPTNPDPQRYRFLRTNR